jgi:hypothetical protein
MGRGAIKCIVAQRISYGRDLPRTCSDTAQLAPHLLSPDGVPITSAMTSSRGHTTSIEVACLSHNWSKFRAFASS